MFDWICVIFRLGPQGKATFCFAGDLARTLSGDKKVMVLVGEEPGSAARLAGFDPNKLQMDRVKKLLAVNSEGLTVETRTYTTGTLPEFPKNSLLVDRHLAARRCGIPIMVPFEESGINSRSSRGPIVIPFGDGLSGVRAGRLTLPLAHTLRRSVIFYHTSWREPGVTSEDPRDHMCTTARANMHELEHLASLHEVPATSVIEMTDDTAEGILQCTMRSRASLLVMARRLKPGIGCYVTRILEQSPVPLLISNHPDERRLA